MNKRKFELLSFLFSIRKFKMILERNVSQQRAGRSDQNMATEYKIENRVLYIYLDGDLDHHLAKKVKHKCDIILKSYPIKDIEFDFKNSGFIDSSGIGVILGRYRQVQAMGGTVKVSNMSASVRKIIHMAGLHQLIEEI